MNKKYFRIWLVHGFLVDYREQEREWIQQQRAEHRDQEEENSSLLRTKIPFSDAQPHTISGRHGWTSTHFRAGSFIVTVTVTWEEKNARHHHFWKKERSKKKKSLNSTQRRSRWGCGGQCGTVEGAWVFITGEIYILFSSSDFCHLGQVCYLIICALFASSL